MVISKFIIFGSDVIEGMSNRLTAFAYSRGVVSELYFNCINYSFINLVIEVCVHLAEIVTALVH